MAPNFKEYGVTSKMKSYGGAILPHVSLEYFGPSTGRNFVQLISGVTSLSANDLLTLIRSVPVFTI